MAQMDGFLDTVKATIYRYGPALATIYGWYAQRPVRGPDLTLSHFIRHASSSTIFNTLFNSRL
jgi:hypothetical protein